MWTIVVGGGSGRRFGRAKQYELLDSRRVIDVSREIAAASTDGVVIVVPPADVEREGGVAGGETRSESVRAGLAVVPDDADVICVHDAARPLASRGVYDRVIAAVLAGADAAIPAVAVTDTIKVIDRSVADDDDILGSVVETPDRSRLVAVQTPQAFRAERLRDAHGSGSDATDDAALVEAAGGRVVVVRGDVANRKITEPDDLEWARRHIAREQDR
ncbi:IspD/TarI family cytidylyltransferase, partial [Ilumatobacter sp.]|uniref:IspD/TarI family cytidylyltransferase n=1 Tax=Ilumatobacter sp. TaxID=1967498 RepID=UPI003C4F8A2D